MIDNTDFQRAVDLIDKSGIVLLTTHTRPDGDACGCIVAMAELLSALGKEVAPLLLSPVPDWYAFLFAEHPPILGEDVTIDQFLQGKFAQPDLIMILDTNSESQLPKFEQYLKQNDTPVLVIDHHGTSDGLAWIAMELVEGDWSLRGSQRMVFRYRPS